MRLTLPFLDSLRAELKPRLRRLGEVDDRNQWPEYHAWLKGKLEALSRVLGPRVRNLQEQNGA